MHRFRLSRILLCGLVSLFFVTSFAATQNSDAAAQVLPAPYQKWLDEDVRYLITDQERDEFETLKSDQQRDKFVEQFWDRRNPNPGSSENPFKEEHYRRLAYVNEQFAARVPGYKTDRGRVYIVYGPPDEREVYPADTSPNLPPDASPTRRHRNEVWRYNFIQGLGRNIVFDFVDKCDCGEYQLNHDPTKRRLRQSQNKEKMVPSSRL